MKKRLLDSETSVIAQLIDASDNTPWELWEKAINNDWKPTQIPMHDDITQWKLNNILSDDERLLVKRTIGFFSGGESLVGNNLFAIARYITDGSCRHYLSRQIFEESLHSGTVKVCCEAFGLDKKEVGRAFDEIPTVKAKDEFLMEFTSNLNRKDFDIETDEGKREFIRNLFAFFIICEGVFFYSGFAMTLALGRQNKLNGLCDQIKYTLRDESLHIQFGIYLLNRLRTEYPELFTKEFIDELVGYLKRAVDLEIAYAKEALPNGILGLNSGMFIDYMQFIGNRRLEKLGFDFRFPSNKNPFPWLGETVDIKPMGAFFERHERAYQPAGAVEDDL